MVSENKSSFGWRRKKKYCSAGPDKSAPIGLVLNGASWSFWLTERRKALGGQSWLSSSLPPPPPPPPPLPCEEALPRHLSQVGEGYCTAKEALAEGPVAIKGISSSRINKQQVAVRCWCQSQTPGHEEAQMEQQDLIRWRTATQVDLERPPRGRNKFHLLLLLCLFVLLARPLLAGRLAARQVEQPIYRTVLVTRACEWKSNLFVPKSNDILFAQPSAALADAASASSVVYETFGQPAATTLAQTSTSSTLLSTESKALVLALPIVFSPTFAGYEPACSIRLIVPRNMRILAKLTSRRLAFAQEQLQEADMMSPIGEPSRPSLWLNVSQNQFIETEQRSFESDSNVLAFRFLLDRFANKQVPDARFQVILTAFQTLSENSDLSGQQQVAGPTLFGQEQQFICDQQRLISADLACDGFRNCQDGQDEEAATCQVLRNAVAGQPPQQQPPPPPPDDQRQLDESRKPQNQKQTPPIWVQVWQFARDSNSLAGFLFGFLLILALLTCCTCCVYLGLLLWRRRQRQLSAGDQPARTSSSRAPSLSDKEQDEERTALAAKATRAAPPPPRLQSILKRPGDPGARTLTRPSEPPPPLPARLLRQVSEQQERLERHQQIQRHQQHQTAPTRRGALASQLSESAPTAAFKPTPAQRATRPTRPVPPAPPAELRHLSTSSTSTTERTTITKTGTHRVTTYEYQAGKLSESLLQRLSSEGGSPAPPPPPPPAPSGDIVYHSTQSSLI